MADPDSSRSKKRRRRRVVSLKALVFLSSVLLLSIYLIFFRREEDGDDEREASEASEPDNSRRWLVGVQLTVLGTAIAAVGNLLVTKSSETKNALYAVIGNFLIVVVGSALTLISYSFASQSLLAPLAGLTIVWNALLTRTRFFEKPPSSTRVNHATVSVFIGCVLIVAGASKREPVITLDTLASFATAKPFVAYAVAYAAACIATRASRSGIARAGFGGLVGGVTNLLAKLAVETFKPNRPLAYVLIAALGACAAIQLSSLNLCLKRYPPSSVVPAYQAALLFGSTLTATIFFDEVDELTKSPTKFFGFFGGAALIAAGLIVVGGTPTPKRDSE